MCRLHRITRVRTQPSVPSKYGTGNSGVQELKVFATELFCTWGARPRTARVCAPSRSRCCSRKTSGSASGSRSSGGSRNLHPSLLSSQLLGEPGTV